MAPIAGLDGLEPTFQGRLQALIEASNGRLYIVSGYRSNEEQARLYAEGQARHGANVNMWVAPPGKSNHNKGLAADLGGDLAWAAANAGRFGLFFPMDHEPWHIEPLNISTLGEGGSGVGGQYDPALGYTAPPEPVDPVDALAKNVLLAMNNPTPTLQVGASIGAETNPLGAAIDSDPGLEMGGDTLGATVTETEGGLHVDQSLLEGAEADV